MLSSKERVERFRKRQEGAGKRLVSVCLDEKAREALRTLSRPLTQGEIIEQAIASFLASNADAQKVLEQRQG